MGERAEGFWWVRETFGTHGFTEHGEEPDRCDWSVVEVLAGKTFWPGSWDHYSTSRFHDPTLEWGPYLGKTPLGGESPGVWLDPVAVAAARKAGVLGELLDQELGAFRAAMMGEGAP